MSATDVHPDLLVATTETVERNKRYEIWPNSCYLFYARLVPKPAASEFVAVLFSTVDPDQPAFDFNKAAFGSGLLGQPDTWEPPAPVFFENGLYVKTEASADVEAYVEFFFVDRTRYCEAFPETECELVKCWEEACGRGDTPFLDNFWSDSENQRWANSGSGSGGENRITQAGEQRITQGGDNRVTQQLDT